MCIAFVITGHRFFSRRKFSYIIEALPNVSVMILFQMFFEEGNGGKFLIEFTRLSIDFDKTFILR